MFTHLVKFAVDYSYNYSSPVDNSSASRTGTLVFVLITALVVTALVVIAFAAYWKVFQKAGKPGWAAIVPIYNSWVLAEIAGKPGWWGLYPLIALVPFVGWIVAMVISLIISLGIAKNFGKSNLFGVIGLWLFQIVGFLILGFGSAKYIGMDPQPAMAGPVPTPTDTPIPPETPVAAEASKPSPKPPTKLIQ